MAIIGPRPKFLMVVDLDYTIFNHAVSAITWLGGKEFWLQLLSEISDMAAASGMDMILAIVTNKNRFDDLSEQAAKELLPFLSKHNPFMFMDKDNKPWCLVNLNGCLQYECLNSNSRMAADIKNNGSLFSHFVVIPDKNKGVEIDIIAKHYQIPLDHCFLLDDTPIVLRDAKSFGINTISFECFHPALVSVMLLDDTSYVSQKLNERKSELRTAIRGMLDTVLLVQLDSQFRLLSLNTFSQQFKTSYPDYEEITRESRGRQLLL